MRASKANHIHDILVIGVLLILGTAIYSNTFQSSFHFDDTRSIVENYSIRNISNLRDIWNSWPTRFITYLSFAVNYHFGKLNVFGYHIVNLLIHFCASIMVWRLLRLTFSAPAMRSQDIAKHADLMAFFGALIFLSHPIQTQAVTYIVQRAASLAALFYLASLTLYVKSRLLQEYGTRRMYSTICFCGSIILAIIAMFTKEMAITLPITILLYEYCFLRTRKYSGREYLIIMLATVSIIPLTMYFTKSVDFIEMKRVVEPALDYSPRQYFLTEIRVVVTYIRLLFIPINQNFDYDYPVINGLWETPVLTSFFLVLALILLAIKIFTKYRFISFGIFWFFLTLLPESGIIPIRDNVVYEHRLYLPMVGLCFFLPSLSYYAFERRAIKPLFVTLFTLILCYAVLTYQRNFVWRNDFTLWVDTASKSPYKARPYNGCGIAYYDAGDYSKAISEFSMAIKIDPDYAEPYNGRGNAYYKQGDMSLALLDFNAAIKICPNYVDAYNNRGCIYSRQGDLFRALHDYAAAIKLNPKFAKAFYNRAVVYGQQGELALANSDFSETIKINPDNADAYYGRAVIYYMQKKYDKARLDTRRAKALGYPVNPDFLKTIH